MFKKKREKNCAQVSKVKVGSSVFVRCHIKSVPQPWGQHTLFFFFLGGGGRGGMFVQNTVFDSEDKAKYFNGGCL